MFAEFEARARPNPSRRIDDLRGPRKNEPVEPNDPSRVRDEPVPDAIQRAIDYGIDISLLEANLRLTPLQRMDAHDSALAFALELKAAGVKKYGRPPS